MNKYLKYSLAYFVGAGLLVSCDVMDTHPKASFSEEMVWQTEQTADAYAINTYNNVVGYLIGSPNWEACTPNGIQCSQVGEGINSLATELELNSSTNYGFGRFENLRACNLLIQKASEAAALSEEKKRELVAEGKFLRGCLFFDMARKMGRFVPVTEVLDIADSLKFKMPATQSVAESYKYVMADLTDAAYNMPETSLPGRANRYAAHLIRSRAALQAYAYTGNKDYLDSCIVSANKVIGGKYELTSDYGSLFNDKSPTDAEIIWGRYYLSEDFTCGNADELIRTLPNISVDDIDDANATQMKNPNGRSLEGWAIYFPTQDLIDQYLVVDKASGEAVNWYESSQFTENVDVLDPNSVQTVGQVDTYARKKGDSRSIPTTQDLRTGRTEYPLFQRYIAVKSGKEADLSDIMYKNRDKRMDATVVRDKGELQGETLEMNLNGNAAQGVREKEDGGWYNTVSGYYWKKGVYTLSPRAYSSTKTDYHYVIARLGEAYMNLAEAYLLKKDIRAAVEALNATRVKHGGLSASKANTEKEAWTDYMRERRVEMAYENGDIYFSYLRWGKYGGYSNYDAASAVGKEKGAIIKDLDRPVYKIEISRDRKKALIGQITLLDSWNRNFTERRYLFPIPQGSINERLIYGINDGQNEGW